MNSAEIPGGQTWSEYAWCCPAFGCLAAVPLLGHLHPVVTHHGAANVRAATRDPDDLVEMAVGAFAISDHVAVPADPYDRDIRIAGVQGDRFPRRELQKRGQALLQSLHPDENVLWALSSSGATPRVGALTSSRLFVFSLLESASAPHVLKAPYTLDLGRKKVLGQVVMVADRFGNQVELTLNPLDLQELRRVVGPPAATADGRNPTPGTESSAQWPNSEIPGRAVHGGGWQWGRPVLSWRDAELMAADHMRHLGYEDVSVTPPGPDNGLDVIARTGAAQVKFHEAPTGAPDVQRLHGAANSFATRLFYAMGYTQAGLRAAEELAVPLFLFTTDGDVVGYNRPAQELVAEQAPTAPGPQRGAFGRLTRQGRQERALDWARQVQEAARVPISNRKRKGARELVARQQATQLVLDAMAQLKDSDNPLYKDARKDRTVGEAEKSLKRAATVLGIRLR